MYPISVTSAEMATIKSLAGLMLGGNLAGKTVQVFSDRAGSIVSRGVALYENAGGIGLLKVENNKTVISFIPWVSIAEVTVVGTDDSPAAELYKQAKKYSNAPANFVVED
jgi:hypothetical protein